MSRFLTLLRHDLRLAARQPGDWAAVLAFYMIAVAMFPLGVGPEPNLLARIASGVLWVCALFAVMLSFERQFAADWEDGTLDMLLSASYPVELVVLARATANWLVTGLPLVAVAPVLALTLGLQAEAYPGLVAAVFLGTPGLSLLGTFGAALVLGARRAGVLSAILILPLTVPALIFGVGAVEAAAVGENLAVHLAILAALSLMAVAIVPWAAAAALRMAVE